MDELLRYGRRALLLALALAALACEAFRPAEPIPPSRRDYVGVWRSASGFVLRIGADGVASLQQIPEADSPDALRLNVRVAPPVVHDLRVEFQADTSLLLITPLLYARRYHIDRAPWRDGDTVAMVLNGVRLVRRDGGR